MTERIQLLDDLGAEIARVTANAERPSRRPLARAERLFRPGLRARTLAGALSISVVLAGGAYAVPATRTAVDSIASSLTAWVAGGGHDAPGRALEPGDDVPAWFRQDGQARLIAKTGGVGLYARRVDSDDGPQLEFGLGEGVGMAMSGPLEGWLERLGEDSIGVLGTALFGPRDVLDGQGRVPLLGLAARNVERVEVRYLSGPPLIGPAGEGGFVLLVDAWRPLRELVAYDARGREVGQADVGDLDLRYLCEKEPTCPVEAPPR